MSPMEPVLDTPLRRDSSQQRSRPVKKEKPLSLRSTASRSAPPTPRMQLQTTDDIVANMDTGNIHSPTIVIEDTSIRPDAQDDKRSSTTWGDDDSERSFVDKQPIQVQAEAGAQQAWESVVQLNIDHRLHEAPGSVTSGSVPIPAKSISRKPSLRAIKSAYDFSKALKPEDKLCTACKNLNLITDKFVIDQKRHLKSALNGRPDFHGTRSMGTFRDIKVKAALRCPLCQLLARSLGTVPAADSSFDDATCALRWTVDGSERILGKTDAQHQTSPELSTQPEKAQAVNGADAQARTLKRTRRLAIEWSNKPKSVAYIVLVAPGGRFADDGSISDNDQWDGPTMFLGRLLTAIDQSNLDLARKWLEICKLHHSVDCQVHADLRTRAAMDLRSSTFTVIDVKQMCLTDLPPSQGDQVAQYIALSYTWGEESRFSGGHSPAPAKLVERFKTTKDNVRQLEEKGGIRKVLSRLPMAIQNAIYLTDKLGYRYVWVDSLCITQDDNDSWMLNAEVMDVIYGNAELTICAADGDGADKVGLVALFPPKESRHARHAEQHIVDYPISDKESLKLLLSWPSESYIALSRWNTRAWTFQERLLSPRCLIFVAGRMYLQCRSTTMSEDIYSEYAVAGWSVELLGAPAHTLKRIHQDPVSVYKNCLGMYTSRHLSKAGDILAAFNGIENIIRTALAVDCDAIFGLPASHFDWALLWEPEELPQRRVVDDRVFPSWSWCGWQGKRISYSTAMVSGPEINLHEWLLRHTWINYYIRTGRGELRLVWDPKRHQRNNNIDARLRGYDAPTDGSFPMGIFYHEGLDEPKYDFHGRPWSSKVNRQGRVDHAGEQFSRRTPEFRRNNTVLKPGETSRAAKNEPRQDKHFLQFWTYAADFSLGEFEQPPGSGDQLGQGLKRFSILDIHGDPVGSCVLAANWADTDPARKRQQRFIALSDAREFDMTEYDSGHLSYTEPKGPWQVYNVMLLETKKADGTAGDPDEDVVVAYRAGLGKVLKSAFPDGMNYGWKEVVLG